MRWIEEKEVAEHKDSIQYNELSPGDWFIGSDEALIPANLRQKLGAGHSYPMSGTYTNNGTFVLEPSDKVCRVTFDCSNLRYVEAE